MLRESVFFLFHLVRKSASFAHIGAAGGDETTSSPNASCVPGVRGRTAGMCCRRYWWRQTGWVSETGGEGGSGEGA